MSGNAPETPMSPASDLVGLMVLTGDFYPDEEFLAYAHVGVDLIGQGTVAFTGWTGATMGYQWATWVYVHVSPPRRQVSVFLNMEGEWELPLVRSMDDIDDDDVVDQLSQPSTSAEFFVAALRAAAPTLAVRSVDESFLHSLSEKAPPWPQLGGAEEIEGMARWAGPRIP